MESMAYVIGYLIGLVLALGVITLLSAVFLRLMVQWVLKEKLAFGKAFLTSLFATLASFGLNFVMGFAYGMMTQTTQGANVLAVFLLPFSFLLQSWIISARVPTSFGKACLIELGIVGIYIVLGLVVGIMFGMALALGSK